MRTDEVIETAPRPRYEIATYGRLGLQAEDCLDVLLFLLRAERVPFPSHVRVLQRAPGRRGVIVLVDCELDETLGGEDIGPCGGSWRPCRSR